MLTSGALAQVGGAVQPGDIAFGLSRFDPIETALRARKCESLGGWQQLSFLQSMEFDNAGGSHSACGNLLALNFGATPASGDPTTGGGLHVLATDGTDSADSIYQFHVDAGGIESTRVSGLSVSPDNNRVAVFAYDTGSVIVFDYDAGPKPGSGSEAGVFDPIRLLSAAPAFTTQGTAWLDNDSFLLYRRGAGDSLGTQVVRGDISGSTITATVVATITVPAGGSQFLDIDYNPVVSPYVYCQHSSFTTATINTLTILDPADWSVVNTVNLSTSMNTAREIALGPDKTLYMAAYGGADAPGPIVDVLDVADPDSIADNSSTDCYQAVDERDVPISSSFNGMDVAVESCNGGPPPCPADLDGSGAVNGFDLALLLGSWGPCAGCLADLDDNNIVNGFDLALLLGSWGPCPLG
jgi:hypothetical protein